MKILDCVINTLQDMKATDIACLDVAKLTSITDHMVIATGNTTRHTRSMMNALLDMAVKESFQKPTCEGDDDCQWVLVNFGDVICHIMIPETRQYYALEKLWGS